jgi:hypothetical protein
MNALRLKNYAARGFAAELASHGIVTARAFPIDRSPAPLPASRSASTACSPPSWSHCCCRGS